MAKQIDESICQEVNTLKRHRKDDLIDHFANKLLKIAWETSKFETGENMIEFEKVQNKFNKLNLGISRYQRILDKLNEEKPELANPFDTQMTVFSSEKIQCKFEGCKAITEGKNAQEKFMDHYFEHVKDEYR